MIAALLAAVGSAQAQSAPEVDPRMKWSSSSSPAATSSPVVTKLVLGSPVGSRSAQPPPKEGGILWYGTSGQLPVAGCAYNPAAPGFASVPLAGRWVPLHFHALDFDTYLILGLQPADDAAVAEGAATGLPLRGDVLLSRDGGASWTCEGAGSDVAPVARAGASSFVISSTSSATSSEGNSSSASTAAAVVVYTVCVAGGRPLVTTDVQPCFASPTSDVSCIVVGADGALQRFKPAIDPVGGGTQYPLRPWWTGPILPSPLLGATVVAIPRQDEGPFVVDNDARVSAAAAAEGSPTAAAAAAAAASDPLIVLVGGLRSDGSSSLLVPCGRNTGVACDDDGDGVNGDDVIPSPLPPHAEGIRFNGWRYLPVVSACNASECPQPTSLRRLAPQVAWRPIERELLVVGGSVGAPAGAPTSEIIIDILLPLTDVDMVSGAVLSDPAQIAPFTDALTLAFALPAPVSPSDDEQAQANHRRRRRMLRRVSGWRRQTAAVEGEREEAVEAAQLAHPGGEVVEEEEVVVVEEPPLEVEEGGGSSSSSSNNDNEAGPDASLFVPAPAALIPTLLLSARPLRACVRPRPIALPAAAARTPCPSACGGGSWRQAAPGTQTRCSSFTALGGCGARTVRRQAGSGRGP